MTSAQLEKAMKKHPGPDGATNIGTGLVNRILEPLVYSALDSSSTGLKRPLLVCIITDGDPFPEARGVLQEEIGKCMERLVNAEYEATAVRFLVSQIGDDDSVHCTTDSLDSMFEDLKGNDSRLEEWLLKVLTAPIMGYGGD